MIRDASVALAQVRSFSFTITQSEGMVPLGLGLAMGSAQGALVAPDRARLHILGKAGDLDVQYDVVGIGERTWMTSPFTSRWFELPGLTMRYLANPQHWAVPLVALNAPALTGIEQLGTVPNYAIEGTIDTSVVRSLIPSLDAAGSAGLKLWIDQQTRMPRRVAVSGALWSGDSPGVVRTLEISNINQAFQIDMPV